MAIFPCDWNAHRYPGKQRSAYVISAYGEDLETTKLRLCEGHFHDFTQLVQEDMARVDEDSSVSGSCDICDKDKNFAVYVKLFDLAQEPDYYAADLCARCWQDLRVKLKVASGKAMAAR
ncbi:MAG TPA: hypothetical protein VH187_23270 [Scandinavium sp.]|jgi:hypothetical protein|uniref:hypothetical protein n=1 Tax=Scandinavium sp. TaxID=2830653 RepID=UPI002E31EDCD|nr:hypothetical protein [Scandinavium sp.]HEX4504050.1 hypothetical protein [Scandinavium sp.]